ncbi:MAG TPA: hypothetical protein VMY35_16885, partial [Phycisphaerae bacterium]|nr:hypothetical protein [Phycisphaerae bacterium]
MTAFTEAQARKLKHRQPFSDLTRRYGDGFWKAFTNFDASTGAISVTVSDTVAATDALLFTVGPSSGTTPRISIASPSTSGKTGDFILSVRPGTLAASR